MTLYIKIKITDEHSGVIYTAEEQGKKTDVVNTICKALNIIQKIGAGDRVGWEIIDWVKQDFFRLNEEFEKAFGRKKK